MIGTKGKLALAALIVGGAAFLVLRRPAPPALRAPAAQASQEVGHATGIDRSMAAVLAMQKAPEGATPCESAYNAFKASKDVSDSQAVKAVVYKLAPRDEFLAKCGTLPPGTQKCLLLRYASQHRDECDRARATPETLSPMVELLQRSAPGGPSDDIEPPPMSSATMSPPPR